jgi:hypothetical protein
MGMPGRRGECGRSHDPAGERREPHKDGDSSPQAAQQKDRSKSRAQNGGAAPRPDIYRGIPPDMLATRCFLQQTPPDIPYSEWQPGSKRYAPMSLLWSKQGFLAGCAVGNYREIIGRPGGR